MVKRFLITTALEETWSDDEPVLFLGEWCKRYSRKDRWSKIDAETLAYHWDDREKLYDDYLYLKELHERLLRRLASQLNDIHGVNHSLRYWRILIGPWLGFFVPMLFDRWSCIQQAVNRYDISRTTVLASSDTSMVPNDMGEFTRFCQSGADWNHHIYTKLLKGYTRVCCTENPSKILDGVHQALPLKAQRLHAKQILRWFYQRVVRWFIGDKDSFFLLTRLPLLDQIRLYFRLREVPKFWQGVAPLRSSVSQQKRQWAVSGVGNSDFELCISELIPQQIPTSYLEGYSKLLEQTEKLAWPDEPRLIWTSNSYSEDDVFKVWAAEKVEAGSKLVIGQHGGHYGIGRWSFFEEHETAISDCYLSWGWRDAMKPNIRGVGQLTNIKPIRRKHANKRNALLVTCVLPQYSYWMYSVFVASQYLSYFDDQCKFVAALPTSIRQHFTVRLFPHDWEWDQMKRWGDRFPNLSLDPGSKNMRGLIRESRLYVSTYNATTFLDSFNMDVPTVIFWNPDHWELRQSAIPYFEDLKQASIFHETPESAARHVAAVWDHVDDWWGDPDVRAVLEKFKNRYCRTDGLLDRVEVALNEVVAGTN